MELTNISIIGTSETKIDWSVLNNEIVLRATIF